MVYLPDGKPGDANGAVITALMAAGKLLAKGIDHPFLPAFVAFKGPDHLSDHAAMVHFDGKRQSCGKKRLAASG